MLAINEIAGAVGVHPVTLAREFRSSIRLHCGADGEARTNRFCLRELVKRDALVAAIAIAAGFYDQSHFARTFKKLIGVTPIDYRDNFRRAKFILRELENTRPR